MTAPRSAAAAPVGPTDAPTVSCTADAAQMTAHRAALRARLAPAPTAEPSPVYPFVLAHPLAEHALRNIAGGTETPPTVVHVAQEIRIRRLPRPDERIGAALNPLGARTRPGGASAAVRTSLSDTGGAPIGELVTTVMLTGGPAPDPFGELPRGTAPRQDGAGEPVSVPHRLSAEWIARYAEASGDRNPIHLDPAAARDAGFGSVIAHGMAVVGLACEEILDRFAGGSPARVRSLGGRFSAPVPADDPFDVRMEPDADGSVVGFSCRTAQGPAVKGGWVELGPTGAAEAGDD